MKLDLLDFSSPNVGCEDMQGKDICSCCRTYYVVSLEELAEAKEVVSDLYEACNRALTIIESNLGDTHPLAVEKLREALAKVEK